MKLSDLKVKDDFHFVGGQVAKYKIIQGRGFYLSEMKTNEHTVYEVLKKNKKSLSCRIVLGSLEFTFVFDGGDDYHKTKGVDCDVVIKT